MIQCRHEAITPLLLGELQARGLLTSAHPVDNWDILLTARVDGSPVGCQVLRPMYFSHSLEVNFGVSGIRVVDHLFRFAEGFAAHARNFAPPSTFAPAGTLFQCLPANGIIRKYMESRGATAEPDSPILYRYDLP